MAEILNRYRYNDINSVTITNEGIELNSEPTLDSHAATKYYVDNQFVFATQQDVDNLFGFYYVDLGLPSGNLWATMNIGAESPEQIGQYFAWGETTGYYYEEVGNGRDFSWSEYKYGTSIDSLTKYNSEDGLTELELEDDAAYANTNGRFRIPSESEWNELFNNTTHEFITLNNVDGIKFISNSDPDKFMFIPFTSTAGNGDANYQALAACWMNNIFTSKIERANIALMRSSDGCSTRNTGRCYGITVRGVLIDPNNDYVDLGLPSGTKWAKCNIGAKVPEEAGLYFAWGETQGYTAEQIGVDKQFSWSDYKYANGDILKLTKYCTNSSFGDNGFTDTLTALEDSDDAAFVNTNGRFRMPTYEQQVELFVNTNLYLVVVKDGVEYTCPANEEVNENGYMIGGWDFSQIEGGFSCGDLNQFIKGIRFENKLDNTKFIFVPANGNCNGDFWSSSLYSDKPYAACHSNFGEDEAGGDYYSERCLSASVRGVLIE